MSPRGFEAEAPIAVNWSLTTAAEPDLIVRAEAIPNSQKRENYPPGGELVSREQLYELVWSMPMTKVAEKFSVSGEPMARGCSALRVPRPELGYWAKLNVGKAPARPALPEALPGDQLIWSQVAICP